MTAVDSLNKNASKCFLKHTSGCFFEDGNFRQIEFTNPNSKCGEVLVASTGSFTFVCALCGRRFEVLEDFGEHIRLWHMQIKIENEAIQLEELDRQDPLSTNLKEEKNASDSEDIGHGDVEDCPENVELSECRLDEDVEADKDNGSEKLKKIEEDESQTKVKDESPPSGSSDKKHVCDVCGRGYVHRRSYQAHIKKAHVVSTKPLRLLWDIPALNVPISENTCKYCDKQFQDTDALQVHLSTHTGRKRFVCRYCSKTFSCRTTRLQHLSIHTGERHYKCPHCPKTFSGKSNLTSHIRAHLKIKNYSCDYCDKRFVQSSEKKVHELTHTGEKPHQCEECGQRYPTSNKLNEHLRRHKNIKNYKCEICGKAFYGLNLLKNHMPTHTGEKPFSCNICGQTFPRMKSLKTHKQLHSGEKNYVCNKCGKAFAQFAGLYSHMKTHGEKPG